MAATMADGCPVADGPGCSAKTLWGRIPSRRCGMGGTRGPLAPVPRFFTASIVVFLAFLELTIAPDRCTAYGRPSIDVEPGIPGRTAVAVRYSTEHLTPDSGKDDFSRGTMEFAAAREISRGLGIWARAKGTWPWSESDGSWKTTDLDFGPYACARGLAGRFDFDGWITMAVPSGDDPEEDVWYGGVSEWSYGVGARIAGKVMGVGKPTHLALGFDVRYRSQARTDWIYLPYHSVAVAGGEGGSGGAVLAWQARLEMRSGRARLATVVLREEPIDSGGIISGKEKPLFIIQSAGVRAGKGIGVVASGELLVSADEGATSFNPRSVLPAWGFSVGLVWERDFTEDLPKGRHQ